MNLCRNRNQSGGMGIVPFILIALAILAMLYYMGVFSSGESTKEVSPGAQKLKNTFIKDHDEMQKQIDDLK